MDVFAKLNEYLNKDDDSFECDPSELELDDSTTTQKTTNSNEIKPRRSKRGRPITVTQNTDDECLVLDLVTESDLPTRGKKSRKKLADEIPTLIEDEIDLTNSITPEVTPNVTKGKRGGRKPRAPRKVSYKKALEILKAPIPDINVEKPRSSRVRPLDNTVDLTGDVILGDQHNKNPLFHKVEDSKSTKAKKYEESLSLEIEDDWDKIRINVKMLDGKIRNYRIKEQQHFYELFKMIADDEGVPVSNVFCFNGNKRIDPEETPETLNHRVSNIYTCRLMDAANVTVSKKDMIEIKFQSDKWKKAISLKVSRFEPFNKHIEQLCKQVKFKIEQFSLSFDGDDIDMKKSPIELEFEGGEIIDCRIKA